LARKLTGLYLGPDFGGDVPVPLSLGGFPGRLSSETYLDPRDWDRIDSLKIVCPRRAPIVIKGQAEGLAAMDPWGHHYRAFWDRVTQVPPGSKKSPLCFNAVCTNADACAVCDAGDKHGMVDLARMDFKLLDREFLRKLAIQPSRYFISLPPEIAIVPKTRGRVCSIRRTAWSPSGTAARRRSRSSGSGSRCTSRGRPRS
jgi:hypothetical protein